MITNKEKIMRNLEYVNGGMVTMKTMFKMNDKNTGFVDLLDEWLNTLYETMEMIKEDYEGCQ